MLKSVSIQIIILCPKCSSTVTHRHTFKTESSIYGYATGKLTAIGHTKRLYENSLNFNCPVCKCWHCVEIDPIEVHVYPEETGPVSNATVDEYEIIHEKIDDNAYKPSISEIGHAIIGSWDDMDKLPD